MPQGLANKNRSCTFYPFAEESSACYNNMNYFQIVCPSPDSGGRGGLPWRWRPATSKVVGEAARHGDRGSEARFSYFIFL